MTGPRPSPATDPSTPGPDPVPVAADRPVVGPERSPEELREDLGALRAELGDTVEELAHRVDVPARVRARREETTEQIRRQAAHARQVVVEKAPQVRDSLREKPAVLGGIAFVVVGLLVSVVLRRQRRA